MCSDFTFFCKYVFTCIWISIAGTCSIALYSTNKAGAEIFLFWLGGTVLIYLMWGRIKKVSINPFNNMIYISNFIKEIEVPFENVTAISGSILLVPELVFIKFKVPTEFGNKIIFMPKFRILGGYSEHPIVEWLREIILQHKLDKPN